MKYLLILLLLLAGCTVKPQTWAVGDCFLTEYHLHKILAVGQNGVKAIDRLENTEVYSYKLLNSSNVVRMDCFDFYEKEEK